MTIVNKAHSAHMATKTNTHTDEKRPTVEVDHKNHHHSSPSNHDSDFAIYDHQWCDPLECTRLALAHAKQSTAAATRHGSDYADERFTGEIWRALTFECCSLIKWLDSLYFPFGDDFVVIMGRVHLAAVSCLVKKVALAVEIDKVCWLPKESKNIATHAW